jgi:hypothetical protein
MAATALTANTITEAGLVATSLEVAADNVNGNSFVNNGVTTFLAVTNSTAAVQTLTVTTPNTVDGNAIADKVYNLPATLNYKLRIGPLPVSVYGSTVNFTTSAATVFVAVYQI